MGGLGWDEIMDEGERGVNKGRERMEMGRERRV